MDKFPLTMIPLSSCSSPSSRADAVPPFPLPAARPDAGLSAAGPRKGFRLHDQAGPVHPGGIGTPDDADNADDVDGTEEVGDGSWRTADGEGATAVAGGGGDDPIPGPISR